MDFANMDGGIDMSQLGKAALPVAPVQAAINPYANTADVMDSENFMSDFLQEEAVIKAPDHVNVQMSSSVQNAMSGRRQAQVNEYLPEGASPMDRFNQYLATERRLNPAFSISDLDEMIDYVVEKEKLDNKFKKFNHTSIDVEDDDEETYVL
jgi:hypothetical protein